MLNVSHAIDYMIKMIKHDNTQHTQFKEATTRRRRQSRQSNDIVTILSTAIANQQCHLHSSLSLGLVSASYY
jgi:hypothetical protein